MEKLSNNSKNVANSWLAGRSAKMEKQSQLPQYNLEHIPTNFKENATNYFEVLNPNDRKQSQLGWNKGKNKNECEKKFKKKKVNWVFVENKVYNWQRYAGTAT